MFSLHASVHQRKQHHHVEIISLFWGLPSISVEKSISDRSRFWNNRDLTYGLSCRRRFPLPPVPHRSTIHQKVSTFRINLSSYVLYIYIDIIFIREWHTYMTRSARAIYMPTQSHQNQNEYKFPKPSETTAWENIRCYNSFTTKWY